MLSKNWVVVGHEIVGHVVRVGKNVKHVAAGDRVGVGAQAGSCLACGPCTSDQEPYCDKGQIGTYNGRYADQSKSTGGYASHTRVPGHFVMRVPDNVESPTAAVLMCAGATVYSPMLQHNVKASTTIGVCGLGGLGSMAILIARAMGVKRVVVISHSAHKRGDAQSLGASDFILSTDKQQLKAARRSLDLIINTNNATSQNFSQLLGLLKIGGKCVMVGAPSKPIPVQMFSLLAGKVSLGGSMIASPAEIRQLLQLASDTRLKAQVELRKMDQVNEACLDMVQGKARYRYVLVN